jgi:LysR family transcriptional regulator, glycine cleavage system transcriptional activator
MVKNIAKPDLRIEPRGPMKYSMPPLHALRAFEAAGRLGSFAKAAVELHVTAAAISHHVKALEDFFDVRLFVRNTRKIVLTDEGQLALAFFREGFESLARGSEVLRQRERGGGTFTMSTAPSFAAKWLIPRLDRFSRRHPGVDIRLLASTKLADFQHEPVDAAIRFGLGRYPRLTSERLFGEFVLPLASPELLSPKAQLADLRGLPLLHDDSVLMTGIRYGWREWLDAAGLRDLDAKRGARFDDGHLLLQAAVAGRGVALGRRVLASAELESGALITPFRRSIPLDAGYWLVYPPARRDHPAFDAFRAWLLDEAASFNKALSREAGAGSARRAREPVS